MAAMTDDDRWGKHQRMWDEARLTPAMDRGGERKPRFITLIA